MNNSLSQLIAMERSLKTAAQGEPNPTEEDRIRRAAAGDRRAFAWLVDHHRSLVCAIGLAVVGDVAASEDIAQEVFLGVWPRLGELRNPHSFLPWLRQYTRNTARQYVRGRRRRQTRIAEGAGDDLVMAADDRPSPCEALEHAEERSFLLEAIAALPDPTREAVLLYYREGESAQQVARLLGVSEAAVKQRLHRAREFLRAAVWTRLADVLPRSAPGAAFTAAVLLALPLAAPASAATLTSAGAVGAAGATAKAGVKPLGAAGAAVGYFSLGLAGAVGSIFRNARQLESFAEDPLERRALSLYRKLAVAAVLLFGALIYATVTAGASVLWVGAAALGYLLIVNSLYFWWLPRHAPKAVAARSLQHPQRVRLERLRRVLVSIILLILALLYANQLGTSCPDRNWAGHCVHTDQER